MYVHKEPAVAPPEAAIPFTRGMRAWIVKHAVHVAQIIVVVLASMVIHDHSTISKLHGAELLLVIVTVHYFST